MIPEFETLEIKTYLSKLKGIELYIDDAPGFCAVRLTIKSKHCDLRRSVQIDRSLLKAGYSEYAYYSIRQLVDQFKNDLINEPPKVKATGHRYMDHMEVNRHDYDAYDFDYDQGYQAVKEKITPKKEEKIENDSAGIF